MDFYTTRWCHKVTEVGLTLCPSPGCCLPSRGVKGSEKVQLSNVFPFPTGDNSHASSHQADPTDNPSPWQLHPETIGFKHREHPRAHGHTKLPARNCHSVISKDIHKAQHSWQKPASANRLSQPLLLPPLVHITHPTPPAWAKQQTWEQLVDSMTKRTRSSFLETAAIASFFCENKTIL